MYNIFIDSLKKIILNSYHLIDMKLSIDSIKLGENIKRLRIEKDLSQDELARITELKFSNLAKLEGGFNSNPTLATLISLANVLTKGSIDKLLK